MGIKPYVLDIETSPCAGTRWNANWSGATQTAAAVRPVADLLVWRDVCPTNLAVGGRFSLPWPPSALSSERLAVSSPRHAQVRAGPRLWMTVILRIITRCCCDAQAHAT